mmetsp:Transcript_4403/g.7078  ORF Transcript_4403/g.7078 Transcript_4403/m.7078 type:complete len:208 (+) Transcript_4403:194-817(+)
MRWQRSTGWRRTSRAPTPTASRANTLSRSRRPFRHQPRPCPRPRPGRRPCSRRRPHHGHPQCARCARLYRRTPTRSRARCAGRPLTHPSRSRRPSTLSPLRTTSRRWTTLRWQRRWPAISPASRHPSVAEGPAQGQGQEPVGRLVRSCKGAVGCSIWNSRTRRLRRRRPHQRPLRLQVATRFEATLRPSSIMRTIANGKSRDALNLR